MCDIVPGQLLVSYPREWNINLHTFKQSEYAESIEEKLERHQLRPRKDFPLSLHLLHINPGEENHVTAELFAWFAGQTQGQQPQIGPNYLLSVSGSTPPPAPAAPSAQASPSARITPPTNP